MKFFYLLLILAGFQLLCQARKRDPKQEKHFTISGNVINLNQVEGHRTIKFIFGDILEGRKVYTVAINQADSFNLDVPCHYTQDFYIDYEDLSTCLAIPGESLTLKIDANIWNNKKLEDTYISITGGSSANTNRSIRLFNQEIPNENYIYSNKSNAEKNKSPEEYAAYIREREKVYTDFAREFNKKHPTTSLFQDWQADLLAYKTFEDLMRFQWLYPMYHKEQNDFTFPDNWYDFLSQYNPDDQKVISWAHHGFMSEYESYIFNNIGNTAAPRDLPEKIRHHRDYLSNHTKGFTRQVLLGRFYLNVLKSAELSLFDSIYEPEKIADTYIREVVNQKHKEIKAIAAKQETRAISLRSIDSETMEGLIDTLAKRYSNKVIYIDFWSTWCGPCLEEMPYSKILQKHFKNIPDVVFLFLASKCSEKAWHTKIIEQDLQGEHILLTDDQFNVLSSVLNINGIPHYALVDRKGNIVDKDAPRPSSDTDIINKIEELLK